MPLGEGQTQLASALGGWNMLINAQTDMPDEAWEFVQWMTARRATEVACSGGLASCQPGPLSTQDKEIRDTLPVVVQGEEALKNARSRPVSPYYSDMSLEMQEQFNAVVKRRHLSRGRRRVAAGEPGADRRGGGVASGTSAPAGDRRGRLERGEV